MKKTMIAVALALASMTANAANNPEDWRVSYASVMEHYNAGRLSQAYAELPRLGLSGAQLDVAWEAIKSGQTWTDMGDFDKWLGENGNQNPGNGNGNGGNGNGGSNGQPTSYDKQQDAVIDTKADKAALEADQKRQDDALASEAAQREDGDNRLNASIDQTKQAIANESNIRNQKDQELQAQIDKKVSKDDFDASQQAQNDHINAVQDAAQTANDRATALEGRADGTEAAIRETNKQLEVTDARSIDNAKRLDGVEQVNDRQDGQIADNKAAIEQEAKDRAAGDAATLQSANTYTDGAVKSQADKQQLVDAAQDGQIAGNTAAIAQEAKDRAAGDAATLTAANTHTDKAVATEAAARADGDAKTLKDANSFTTGAVKAQADIQKGVDAKQDGAIAANATAIKTETAVRSQQFNQLSSGVQQAQATGEYAHSRIDAANQNIEANRQAQNDHINAVQDAAQTANDRATALEGRADGTEAAIRETNKQLEVTDARSIDNAKRLDGVEQVNDRQDGQIADNKAAIEQEAKDRAAGDAATLQSANTYTDGAVKSQADKQQLVDAAQDGQIAGNTAAIAQEAKDRAAGDAATLTAANTHTDKAVATEAAARADGDAKTLKDANSFTTGAVKAQADIQKGVDAKQDGAIAANATAIKTETAVRSQQFNQLSSGVQQAQATGEYAHSRIDAANQNIEANRQALVNTNKRVAANTAQLANHEQRLTSLEQQTNKGFSDLKRQIDDNKKDANAGIAGVAAIASIPQVTDKQDFSIGAGVGARGSEQALAVGFSGRITDNVVTKVAVSTDTQSGWTVGAGVAVGW